MCQCFIAAAADKLQISSWGIGQTDSEVTTVAKLSFTLHLARTLAKHFNFNMLFIVGLHCNF